jgi:hypothetical protein
MHGQIPELNCHRVTHFQEAAPMCGDLGSSNNITKLSANAIRTKLTTGPRTRNHSALVEMASVPYRAIRKAQQNQNTVPRHSPPSELKVTADLGRNVPSCSLRHVNTSPI